MLQLPYDGPFTVVSRNDKNFTIRIYDKNTTISIDRIKPAYLFSDSLTDVWETTNNQWQQNQTDSMKRETHEDNERVTDKKNKNSSIPGGNGIVKKTYKRVRFREGFQGGT